MLVHGFEDALGGGGGEGGGGRRDALHMPASSMNKFRAGSKLGKVKGGGSIE